MTAPGLARMKDETPDGLCPFCLDPLPPAKRGMPSQQHAHCGEEECRIAYMRCYQRDRRAGRLVRKGVKVKP